MPYKPKVPCRFPNCPELVEAGQKYCPKHKAQVGKEYRQRRDPSINKRYNNYQWLKIRKEMLAEEPVCAMCRKEGRLRYATVIHHIRPLAEGGTNDRENLVALCKSCHSRIHAERGDNGARRLKVYTYENT